MTPEERKEYNKTYYTTNRKVILEKACNKEKCQFCDRMVSKYRMYNHIKTDLCINTQDRKKLIQERENKLKTMSLIRDI